MVEWNDGNYLQLLILFKREVHYLPRVYEQLYMQSITVKTQLSTKKCLGALIAPAIDVMVTAYVSATTASLDAMVASVLGTKPIF